MFMFYLLKFLQVLSFQWQHWFQDKIPISSNYCPSLVLTNRCGFHDTARGPLTCLRNLSCCGTKLK